MLDIDGIKRKIPQNEMLRSKKPYCLFFRQFFNKSSLSFMQTIFTLRPTAKSWRVEYKYLLASALFHVLMLNISHAWTGTGFEVRRLYIMIPFLASNVFFQPGFYKLRMNGHIIPYFLDLLGRYFFHTVGVTLRQHRLCLAFFLECSNALKRYLLRFNCYLSSYLI